MRKNEMMKFLKKRCVLENIMYKGCILLKMRWGSGYGMEREEHGGSGMG